MILGPWHFSWTVADIERSIAFYCENFSFEVVHRQEQSNGYTETLVGIPGAHLKAALLRFRGLPAPASNHVIELIEYVGPKGMKLDTTPNNIGAAHLAFLVSDVPAKYQELKDKGVRFLSPPVAITGGVNKGGYTCYLKDPDDFTLEILQPSPERLQAAFAAAGISGSPDD